MPVQGSEWDEADFFRHALLGRLTETFNEAEYGLHVIVWMGLDRTMEWEHAKMRTHRLTAGQLTREVRDLLAGGAYGDIAATVEDLVSRMDGPPQSLIERRNRYVHAWWTNAGETREVALARLRDWVVDRPGSLTPYDERDLQVLLKELEQFSSEVLDLFHFEWDRED